MQSPAVYFMVPNLLASNHPTTRSTTIPTNQCQRTAMPVEIDRRRAITDRSRFDFFLDRTPGKQRCNGETTLSGDNRDINNSCTPPCPPFFSFCPCAPILCLYEYISVCMIMSGEMQTKNRPKQDIIFLTGKLEINIY